MGIEQRRIVQRYCRTCPLPSSKSCVGISPTRNNVHIGRGCRRSGWNLMCRLWAGWASNLLCVGQLTSVQHAFSFEVKQLVANGASGGAAHKLYNELRRTLTTFCICRSRPVMRANVSNSECIILENGNVALWAICDLEASGSLVPPCACV